MAVDINSIPTDHRPDRLGSIRGVIRSYPDYTNIISEFIQNAEDANSSAVQFEISKTFMQISNDGDPFTLDDYKKICEFAQGKWGESEKIGKFGVGFISAYHVTDKPTIISNGIRITIQSNGHVDREKHNKSANTKGSTFELPLRPNTTPLSREIGVEPVSTARLSAFVSSLKDTFYKSVLFLASVTSVTGWSKLHNRRSEVCKCTRIPEHSEEISLKNGGHYIHEKVNIVLEWPDPASGGKLRAVNTWHIFTQDFRDNYISMFDKEPPVNKTIASVAFKMGSGSQEETGCLYAFLPTGIQTGFGFNINAHFAPRTGRDDIRTDTSAEGQWNLWLIDCFGELCVNIVDSLKSIYTNPVDFYHIVPIEYNEERSYLSTVVETFEKGVNDKSILYTSKHGWQDKYTAFRVDRHLRSIVETAGPKLINEEIQNNPKAKLLIEHLGVDWYETKDLVALLKAEIQPKCLLREAPGFVRSSRKLARIYKYLVDNQYQEMWGDLANVTLCPDENNVLHSLNSSEDKIYWADIRMRRILAKENVILVKESIQKKHSPFIKKTVERFDMDHLIDYLNEMAPDCIGKKMTQAPTSLLRNTSIIRSIYSYLKNNKVYINSKYETEALENTPLCVTEQKIIHRFNKDDPPAYLANREIRQLFTGSNFPFIEKNLQKNHEGFLANAGIPEIDIGKLLDHIMQNTRDGMSLTEAPVFLNTKDKLNHLYGYLRRLELTDEQVVTVQKLPIFLTSRGNLRPLVGSEQGNLVLGSTLGSDPLKLDILLDDTITKDRKVRKWFADILHINEMTLRKYIIDYLLPKYTQASTETKLKLMRVLKNNLTTIKKGSDLKQKLESSALVRCQDRVYRPGKQLSFQNKSTSLVFGKHYYFPEKIYSHAGRSHSKTLDKGWIKLFEYLGVRKIPHPETIVTLVSSVAGREKNNVVVERSRKLLRFINSHWLDYQPEQEELKTLCIYTWLPAKGDKTQLYDGYDLHLPELNIMIGTQVRFVAVHNMEKQLADLLGINTIAGTGDIVSHLIEISENNKPASVKIYEELDRRRDPTEIALLRNRSIVDINGNGNYWNPHKLFFTAYDLEFGQYRGSLPDRLSKFNWFFKEIGVCYTPEVTDYIELLIEMSDKYQSEVLPKRDRDILQRAYNTLSKNEESITNEQLAELRENNVVLGTDARLHNHSEVFINDYPDYHDLGFSEDPIFCQVDSRGEIFLNMLPVLKFSRAVSPKLVSLENTILDGERTRLLHDAWLEPILRVNYTVLGSQRNTNTDREYLANTEVHAAQQIRITWSYYCGGSEINGNIQEYGAFLDYPNLYFTEDFEGATSYMAIELARALAPDIDTYELQLPYEGILSQTNPETINTFLKLHRYRPLPSLLELTEEDTGFGEPGPSPTPPEPGQPPSGEPAPIGEQGTPSPEPGDHEPSPYPCTPNGRLPAHRPVSYVDVEKLMVVGEEAVEPDEARPFSIGVNVERKTGYYPGPSSSGDRKIYDENIETEGVAFNLVKIFENKRGWSTVDNKGKGFVGYDIKAQRGSEIKYIEVKSSKGVNCSDLSFPQLVFAKKKRSKFFLYRVLNLERSDTSPLLYIIKDPWGYLDLETSAYKTKGYKDNPRGDIKKVVLQEQ